MAKRARNTDEHSSHAISLLKDQHVKIRELLEKLSTADSVQTARELAKLWNEHAHMHAIFAEQAEARDVTGKKFEDGAIKRDLVTIILADLCASQDGALGAAKKRILAELVEQIIQMEEQPRTGLFAKAKAAGIDLDALGEKLSAPERSAAAQYRPAYLNVEAAFTYDPSGRQPEYGKMPYRRMPERDEEGRFMRDDDRRYYGRDYDDGGRRHGGWYRDPEGHSEASRRGWDERDGGRYGRDYDDRDRGGRRHGGWYGDPEEHSEASRRGWDDDRHGGSGWYGDPRGHAEAARRGWDDDRRGGSGWYGDPRGHAEASRRGWDDRRSGYYDDDDDRRYGRRHSGWYGDPEGHSEASRRGWSRRD